MTHYQHQKYRNVYQTGALISLAILAIWGLGVFWLHMVTPAGADMFEITYVGTLTIVLLILLPLYRKQISWGYIGGILMILAMYIGLAKAIVDQSLVLTWSLYNIVTIFIFVVALLCAYFSIRSFQMSAPREMKKRLLGTGGIVLVTIAVAFILWSIQDNVRNIMWQLTLNRIDNQLQNIETLDEKIQFLVDEGDLASATVGIVVNDSLVWAQAYGDANVDSVYNIGSVTKPFVATAILQLHEQELLDLDDDVNKYLPFSLRHPDYPDIPITVHLLLTHQSGMAHFTEQYMAYHMEEETAAWLAENQGWQLPGYEPNLSFSEFIENYLKQGGAYYTPEAWTANRPGSNYSYSTIGYDILAYLVETITDQPFTEYTQDHIFEPLGMTHTGFKVAEIPGSVTLPYERIYGVLSKANAELPLADVKTIGGGGMLSNVPDLASYVTAHLNQGQVHSVELLKPETIALMQQKAVTFPLGRADLNQVSYGLGLSQIRDQPWNAWGHLYDMHGAVGHGGSWFGYQGQMWFVNEDEGGYGIILLTNSEFDFKPEARSLWLFASPLKLQVLLMEEAAKMYQQTGEE